MKRTISALSNTPEQPGGAGCWLCNRPTQVKQVTIRGGATSELEVCESCRFHFFRKDTTELLRGDKLDQTRLARAGLEIPDITKDYENGLRQSQEYVGRFFTKRDRGKSVLEIGCSWGYFLDLARQYGCLPAGIELNRVRAHYVSSHLGIPCYETLEELAHSGQRFSKIFGFYVMEYFSNPVEYFGRLINLLEPGGQLIFISPNLDDVLKDVWRNSGYCDFFYDECAVGYYSVMSIRSLAKALKPARLDSLATEQGYSFLNHVNWHFTNRPRTTGIVGGDRYVSDVEALLRSSGTAIGKRLSTLLRTFDREYRAIIERQSFGNRIVMTLSKE